MSLKHPYGYRAKEIVEIISKYAPEKNQFHCEQKTCFSKKNPCLAEYTLSDRYLATLTGTAFDYLARFQIARKAEKSRKRSHVAVPSASKRKPLFERGFLYDGG